MNATIKSTDPQTIIRLENGCTVTLDHQRETITSWAPGSRLLFQSKPRECDDLSVREAVQVAIGWQAP
jgi:hypothetical protein